MQTTDLLMEYIENSPSPYHAVHSAAVLLEEAGFTRLEECAPWTLEGGRGYYTTRNQSSLIAFRLPEGAPEGWRLAAAHSDSPTFHVKNDALEGDSRYIRLSVEGYGGMNCASWLDRPLTVAGRAIVRTGEGVEGRLVYLDQDLLTIPSLAIHQQRDVNRGHDYNAKKDMQPLYALSGGTPLTALVAEELGVEAGDILSTDLMLCPRQRPVYLGPEGELFQAPRIDDLGCAYAALEGFLTAGGSRRFGQIYCLFDNEEVGSGTRQGALSTFLPDVLERIACCLGMDGQERRMALAGSMLLSADNGHAVHPNFGEKIRPGQPGLSHRRGGGQILRQPEVYHKRPDGGGVPGHLPKGGGAGADLRQPGGRARRLHPGQPAGPAGEHPHGGHRYGPAGHARRRGDRREPGPRLSGPGLHRLL